MTVLEIMGFSPQVNFRKIEKQQIHCEAEQDYLDQCFINYESKKGDQKREVGLQRRIQLPKAPHILDELIISKENGGQASIIRIEKFDIKCAAAFTINDSFNIIENIQLMQGFQLTLARLNKETKMVMIQISIPIDEPTPFKDAC